LPAPLKPELPSIAQLEQQLNHVSLPAEASTQEDPP